MNYVVYSSENVVLTHIIKCKVGILDIPRHIDGQNPNCSICDNEAEVYCENDKEYFCANCDEIAHSGYDKDEE